MSQEFFDNFNQNTRQMYAPWMRLNQAMLANAERMTEFSLTTMKTYSELGLDNLRNASQVDSAEAAKDFTDKQAQIMNSISQQMLKDAERLTELGQAMRQEVMSVMGDVYGQAGEQMQNTMRQTAEQASKAASQFTQTMTKAAEDTMNAATKATAAATQTASKATEEAIRTASQTAQTVNDAVAAKK